VNIESSLILSFHLALARGWLSAILAELIRAERVTASAFYATTNPRPFCQREPLQMSIVLLNSSVATVVNAKMPSKSMNH
jgi:hypothetical protein